MNDMKTDLEHIWVFPLSSWLDPLLIDTYEMTITILKSMASPYICGLNIEIDMEFN